MTVRAKVLFFRSLWSRLYKAMKKDLTASEDDVFLHRFQKAATHRVVCKSLREDVFGKGKHIDKIEKQDTYWSCSTVKLHLTPLLSLQDTNFVLWVSTEWR